MIKALMKNYVIKILDLFSGTQSVKKALTLKYGITNWVYTGFNGVWEGWRDTVKIVEYIGIDIYSPEDLNTILNLSKRLVLNDLIKVLPEGWKPDFIWASPVCQTFSTTITGKGGNLFYIRDGIKLIPRNKKIHGIEGVQPQCKPNAGNESNQIKAELALQMHENTKDIVDYFNVPFAIENPARALSKWLYIDYIANKTAYCMYGFDIQKPTTIYSNIKLNLLKCSHKAKHKQVISRTKTNVNQKTNSYAIKSAVPPKLISEIISQLEVAINV